MTSPTIINAVYYPSWLSYRGKPPSSLRVEHITHVFYAFVRVNANGTLRYLDAHGDLVKIVDGERGCIAALRKLKAENPHIKTIVSIGGGSGSAPFPVLAASREARTNLAREARRFCDSHGFDGVDIDWEHPKTPIHGAHYLELLQAFRDAMPSPQYLVSTALPVGEYALAQIDLEAASNLVDLLNLMCYDFAGNWTTVSGHQSQLWPPAEYVDNLRSPLRKSCSGGVDYLLSNNVSSHKIVLGIPVFARYFPHAEGPGQSNMNAGLINYSDLPNEWVQGAYVNESVGAAAFVDRSGDKGFVSLDVPRTVTLKAKYAKNKLLGGLFYWTSVYDRVGGQSLVTSGYNELVLG